MSFLTSLATAFKGGGQSRVPLTRGFVSPWATAFETTATGGGAPLVCDDPRFLSLIACSCGAQPLLETLAAQLALHGNAYVQIVKDGAGVPVDLHPLRPERVQVIAGTDGWPSGYRYTLANGTLDLALADENGWPNVVHLRGFHPVDDHYGAGCLSAAAGAVAIHNAASDWNRALLANAARPSGALVYDSGDSGGLTAEQFDRLKEELASAFQGGGNAGRPMLLEGGLDWKAMSLSPADMDFATLKAAAARDIALAFGVPPMLLGLPGDNTYANYREANRALWRLTLLPLIAKILDGLHTGLSDWFSAAPTVDLDRVPALSEDREKLWARVTAADFLGPDEKRAMLGLAPQEKSQ